MIVNVGLVTPCSIPRPAAMPLMRHVLPAPSSPLKATRSPARNRPANARPKAMVSAALLEMVIAFRREVNLRPVPLDQCHISRADGSRDFRQRQFELPAFTR